MLVSKKPHSKSTESDCSLMAVKTFFTERDINVKPALPRDCRSPRFGLLLANKRRDAKVVLHATQAFITVI